MYLHEIVKEQRKKLKMTQKELAERAGTTQTEVSHFETGKANVTIDTLSKYLRVLSLDITVIEKKVKQ